MVFVNYPACSTCQKAKKWLQEQGLAFEDRNIKTQPPTQAELEAWLKISGLPVKKLFNTSGLAYKSLGLKDRLPTMTQVQQLALLATDGMLVKRPIVVTEDIVLVGFRQEQWQQLLK